ncbi:hypothetical protein B194_2679 [Serratia plymuthica A30]|nr:hypothetical protein B194_2679 [Serratia plymuthica A30]
MLRKLRAAIGLLGLGMMFCAGAQSTVITDVSGRKVEIPGEVKRIILGEGRQIYLLAAFDTDAPFKRVEGWRDDFPKADYDG